MKEPAEAFEVEVMPAARPVHIEDIGGEVPTITVPAIAASTSEEYGVLGWVNRFRQYAAASEKFARASLAMQVMAGIQLAEIKSYSPYVQGGKRRTGQKPHDAVIGSGGADQKPHDAVFGQMSKELQISGQRAEVFGRFATWEEFVKESLGISADTAGRWIAMAEASKPRLKRLTGWGDLVRDLLERPIGELSGEEIEVMCKAVAKITDGRTQLDFLQELGIVKRPGNPKLGGNTGGRPSASGVIDDDTIKAAANEDWATIERGIVGGGMSFTVLTDTQIEAQIEMLSRAIRVRREWLGATAALRTPATIQSLGKTLV